jgi:hypothetical protein
MRIVSKKIFQTVNSNGDRRTVVNILNRRNNEVIRTQAVSNKSDPSKFHVLHQMAEKKGSKVATSEKMYKMKEGDIIELFRSAEVVGTDNLKKFGAVEDKSLKKKSSSSTIKKASSTKKVKKTSSKKILTKKKSSAKKMKGGNYEATGQSGVVRGFDPTNQFRDMASFQTLEQERGEQKGGNMQEAMKLTLDSVTKGDAPKLGGKKSIKK